MEQRKDPERFEDTSGESSEKLDDIGNADAKDSKKPLIGLGIAIVCSAMIVSGVAGAAIMANYRVRNEDAPVIYKSADLSVSSEDVSAAPAVVTSAATTRKSAVSSQVSKSTKGSKTTTRSAKRSTAASVTTAAQFEYPMDINTATLESLMNINGISRTAAEGVIRLRERNGAIHNYNELLEIYGIGEKTLSVIEEHFFISEDDLIEYTSAAVTERTETVSEGNVTAEQTAPVSETSPPETTAAELTETVSETAESDTGSETEERFRRVNINTASAGELEECLLIRRELAESIVELRNNIKYFSNTLELLYTDGFTTEMYNQRREYLLLEDASDETSEISE